MAKYQTLMNKSAKYEQKSMDTKDVLLKMFYKHASEGYALKALELTLREAGNN